MTKKSDNAPRSGAVRSTNPRSKKSPAKKRRQAAYVQDREADFELLFHPQGTVELLDAEGESVWCSDADDDFADEFEGDFFDGEDAEEILEYLDDNGYVDLDEDDIDITENDLEDESGDDSTVIDADFVELKR
jgi:hypothetical protein